MPRITCSWNIPVPVETAYRLAKDTESLVESVSGIRSIRILERNENTTMSEWESNVAGRHVRWVQQDIVDDARQVIQYQSVNGDMRLLKGEWRFVEAIDGCLIQCEIEFEIGSGLLDALLNPIVSEALNQSCEEMVEAIQGRASHERIS